MSDSNQRPAVNKSFLYLSFRKKKRAPNAYTSIYKNRSLEVNVLMLRTLPLTRCIIYLSEIISSPGPAIIVLTTALSTGNICSLVKLLSSLLVLVFCVFG